MADWMDGYMDGWVKCNWRASGQHLKSQSGVCLVIFVSFLLFRLLLLLLGPSFFATPRCRNASEPGIDSGIGDQLGYREDRVDILDTLVTVVGWLGSTRMKMEKR